MRTEAPFDSRAARHARPGPRSPESVKLRLSLSHRDQRMPLFSFFWPVHYCPMCLPINPAQISHQISTVGLHGHGGPRRERKNQTITGSRHTRRGRPSPPRCILVIYAHHHHHHHHHPPPPPAFHPALRTAVRERVVNARMRANTRFPASLDRGSAPFAHASHRDLRVVGSLIFSPLLVREGDVCEKCVCRA